MPPPRNAPKEDWEDYHSQKLLRALPGDEGFVSWLQAKHSFISRILVAVRAFGDSLDGPGAVDGDDTPSAELYASEVLESFPFPLQPI